LESNIIPKKQRALVLGGGGALGAYQVGVLKTLCEKLIEEDKKRDKENGLLFDIVAGTSIGAMNGAVLISHFLESKDWQDSVKNVENFWINRDKGLASSIDNRDLLMLNPWVSDEEWYKNIPAAASKEAARRYYSIQYYFLKGIPHVNYPLIPRPDFKFFDDKYNKWPIHSNEPLKRTILEFARFPIATKFKEKQPRLLVFSVDVSEGQTVTFDSYEKADGSRKSEYGKYTRADGYQHVIKYSGITIEHVMASGTIPEIYDYAKVPIDQTNGNNNKNPDQAESTLTDHGKQINKTRCFWDGGLLSNTPFRELLEAHQAYWVDIENSIDKIPDLDVYIINLHPSKQYNLRFDHDGIKERQNDILFFDRNSYHDENITHMITDYNDLANQMKNLAVEAVSKVKDESEKNRLNKKFETILTTTAISKAYNSEQRKYQDLLKGRFRLTKVVRIEQSDYTNSISGKGADFTTQTLRDLIKQGENDALKA
jgi:NTE family protein